MNSNRRQIHDEKTSRTFKVVKSSTHSVCSSSPRNGDFHFLHESIREKRRNLSKARSELASTLVQLGEHHVRNREYDEAMKVFSEALEEQKSTYPNIHLTSSCHSNINSHQYIDKHSLNHTSIPMDLKNDDDSEGIDMITSTLSKIGNVHSLRGDQDQAMKCHTDIMSIRSSRSSVSSRDAASTSCSSSSLSGVGWNEEDTSTIFTEIDEDVQALDDLFQGISFRNAESDTLDITQNSVRSRSDTAECIETDSQRRAILEQSDNSESREELDSESSSRHHSIGPHLSCKLPEVFQALQLYQTTVEMFRGCDIGEHKRYFQEFTEAAEDLEKKSRLSSDQNECENSIRENALQFALTIYDTVFDLYNETRSIADDETMGHRYPEEISLKVASTLIRKGSLYYKLGNVDGELQMYKEALSVYIDTLGEQHMYVAGTRKNIGMVLVERSDFRAATVEFEKAKEIYLSLNNNNSMDRNVASALSCMGNVQNRQGDLDGALKLYYEALGIFRTLAEELSWPLRSIQDVTSILKIIGMLHAKRSESDQAMDCYQEALQLLRSSSHGVVGKNGVHLASVLTRIGNLLNKKGQFDESMDSYREAYAVATKALKTSEHPVIAGILYYKGGVLQKRGNYDEAMSCYKKCVGIYHKTKGPENPSVAMVFVCIGSIYYRKQNLDMAMRFYKEALRIYEKAYGPYHPDIAPTLKSIAMIHTKKFEYEKAMDLFVEILRMKCVAMGADHPEVANAYKSIGNLHYKKGEYNDAEKQYKHALSIYKRSLGEHNDNTLLIKDMIDTLRRRKRGDGLSRKRRSTTNLCSEKRVSRESRE